jgi:hypothetical protein
VAGLAIWYDAKNLPPGATIATFLPEAIADCRAMILVLSPSALDSPWVEEEYAVATSQQRRFQQFRIIPIRIEECEPPGFLRTKRWLDMPNQALDVGAANQLLASFYDYDVALAGGGTGDVYIARTWRENESGLADYVCGLLIRAGFRLIGDSQDQAGFEDGQRVASIMSSCGGFAVIVPDRGGGSTSEFILDEIQIARAQGLPSLVVAEPAVKLPTELDEQALRLAPDEAVPGGPREAELLHAMETLQEGWRPPVRPHYVFFSTKFGAGNAPLSQAVCDVALRVTAMPCIMGDHIHEGKIQEVISDRIAKSFVAIADISEGNLNTCIEAGIARGANARLHLVCKGPRRDPPFMFGDQQVWFYEDDTELLGIVHRLLHPYRRRVLNYELAR